jgi:hypothetical protein
MKRITCLFAIVLLFVACGANDFPVLSGPYLGQMPPGTKAELFAPGIISNELCNRDVTMSPDGKEMYFSVHTPDFAYASILCSKEVNGVWTRPEVLPFARDPRYTCIEPAMSPDGQRLYFCSVLPQDNTEAPADEDIWYVQRTEEGWSEPINAGPQVNSEGFEFFPSVTEDGSLYFTRADVGTQIHYIYKSKLLNGEFQPAERLPEQINCGRNRYNAYIAPDESFCVVPCFGMPDAYGGTDYYITFHQEDGSWSEPVNMGPEFNHATGGEWSFSMSPDKEVLFFMATQNTAKTPGTLNYDFFFNAMNGPGNGNPDIYWIDASVIDSLKK